MKGETKSNKFASVVFLMKDYHLSTHAHSSRNTSVALSHVPRSYSTSLMAVSWLSSHQVGQCQLSPSGGRSCSDGRFPSVLAGDAGKGMPCSTLASISMGGRPKSPMTSCSLPWPSRTSFVSRVMQSTINLLQPASKSGNLCVQTQGR